MVPEESGKYVISLRDQIQARMAEKGNKVRIVFPNYPFPLLPSLRLLSVPVGLGWLCDLKKASHIASAVMASNTVASKSMEPVLDFAAVSTLPL